MEPHAYDHWRTFLLRNDGEGVMKSIDKFAVQTTGSIKSVFLRTSRNAGLFPHHNNNITTLL